MEQAQKMPRRVNTFAWRCIFCDKQQCVFLPEKAHSKTQYVLHMPSSYWTVINCTDEHNDH